MRNLTVFIDRPTYSQHFASDQPFFESSPPKYSFVGNTLVSLACLSRGLSSTATLPIFCRYTAEAIGSCRVDIRMHGILPPPRSPGGSSTQSRASSPVRAGLPTGGTLGFFVSVDSVKGLSSHDFSSIHLQLHLSSIAGTWTEPEEVFTSNTADLERSIAADLRFRHKFNVVLSPKIMRHLKDGYAPIEFFAIVRPEYLTRLERWEELREMQLSHLPIGTPIESDIDAEPPQVMRRSETDFLAQEIHDVVAWVQIFELAPNGDYEAVQVTSQHTLDSGSFALRQGLQRKILLILTSNSGRQLPWIFIPRLRLGSIRLLDENTRIQQTSAKGMIDLKSFRQLAVEYRTDGTSRIGVEALWDSGAHGSPLLNRVTAANQRVLLRMQWAVDIDNCQDPVMFSMDIAVSVQGRQAHSPGALMNLLSSTKLLTKSSTVFTLQLNPPLTRSAKDLWRLDTSEKYVRGEEALGRWKVRGLSVVQDFVRLHAAQRRVADVNAIKAVLSVISSRGPAKHRCGGSRDAEALVLKVIKAWPKGCLWGNHVSVCTST